MSARTHFIFRLLTSLLFLFSLLISSQAQSGRRKSEQKRTPSPIDATQAPTSKSSSGQSSGTTPEKKAGPKTPGNEVDSTEVLSITSNLVPVPASVFDTQGAAVTDLKLEDFELKVDGLVKPITDLSRSQSPVRMAMLFDNSGSLLASRELEKQAAKRFFGRVLRPSDQAAIYSVSTEYYLAQPLTSDIRRLEQTIEGFGKPEGGTALFDAIVEAASYLRPNQGRKVIVIVSDGADTISRLDFETTMQRVLREDCEVFVVQTGLYSNANVRDLAAEKRMEALTLITGGAVHLPKEPGDLEEAFIQIAADLAQQYVLSYYATDERRDGRYHTIALSIKTRKGTRVRSRHGFYAPRA
ncbi:MAG: VWA domain-containing protein [Acidobacteriota bacterium]|nr:VWA domain-containing protein [Acidobacteriota bacterium]